MSRRYMQHKYEADFEKFHKENPHCYALFYKYAKQAKDNGLTQFSSEAIINRIRWYNDVETVSESFKINNNYKALYVRKLIKEHPEFDGFFELREHHFSRNIEDKNQNKLPV